MKIGRSQREAAWSKEYQRHKVYLSKVRTSSLFHPRYDMLSLNNNLLLHRKHNPKEQLKPKQESPAIKNIQKQLDSFKQHKNGERKEKEEWFKRLVNKGEPEQMRFRIKYEEESQFRDTVRDQLESIYHLRRTNWRSHNNKGFSSTTS